MNEYDRNITQLREALNERHNSRLTDEQVANWVGSDTPASEIKDYYYEVKNNDANALTPEDVLDLWDDIEDFDRVTITATQ